MRRKRRMSLRVMRKRYGHSFASQMKSIGERIHDVAQKHPVATAAVTGAGAATVAGGLSPALAAAVGGAAGVAASEMSKKKNKKD